MVVAKTQETTAGVLNPNTEPKILLSAENALAFKRLSPDDIVGAKLHHSQVKGADGRPKLGLSIKGLKTYVYADDMGLTPDRATAVAALPNHAALAELRRLANYTAAMAGNEKVDMASVPTTSDPELSASDINEKKESIAGTLTTKLGDKLTVLHPQPFIEEEDPSSGGKVVLRKGSTTRITQKYVIYRTSDGHEYKVKRGSFGSMVPASAFPAMINYMQSKQKSLEEQAKALEVVLAASDTVLGPSAAEWLHVLLTTYSLAPTPERTAALKGAMNEFWQTAKLGRSNAWDGIARRYNTALGAYAFLPSWLRPVTNPDGTIDGARRVKEISYAAAASGVRAFQEHGRTTIHAGSSLLSKTFEFGTRTAKATAKTVARKAKQVAKNVAEVKDKVTTEMARSNNEGDAYLVSFAKEFVAGLKAFTSTLVSKVTKPLTSFWKWVRA